MKLSAGYFTIARFRGAPVRVHWLVPLALPLISRLRFEPVLWASFLLIVLLHEIGHAVLARRYRQRVESIDLHPLGGACRYAGLPTPAQRAAIAWGGVLAQSILLVLAAALFLAWPGARPPWLGELYDGLIRLNAIIIAFNLLPFPPLDGAEAWRWFSLRKQERGRRRRHLVSVPPPAPVEAPPIRPPAVPVIEARRPVEPTPRPVIQVIRARTASELLRELDAEEDRGNLPDVKDLVEQIFRKGRQSKRNLPN